MANTANKEDSCWLREATIVERMTWEAHKESLLMTSYALTLNSAQPISEHHVRQALGHLYRKVPTLRLCFKERNDKEGNDDTLWTCNMDGEHVDFKVLEEDNPVKVMEELLNYSFNQSEGPLWCARLLPPGSGHDPLSLPDFPHTRSLVLANHHGIADGTTNARTINFFLQILDGVIAGEAIDDSDQLGELSTGEEIEGYIQAKMIELGANPEQAQPHMKAKKENEEAEKLIPRAFPLPPKIEYQTRILPVTLDEETTKNFFRKCREGGVTVHSGFVALLNGSLVDIVSEAGLKLEEYIIRTMHAVNTRRYCSGDTSRALGVQVSGLSYNISTSIDWRSNFWNIAKEIHQGLLDNLQKKAPLDYICYFLSSMEESPEENIFAIKPYFPQTDLDTANLGNLDKLIPTEGGHVRLTNVIRSTGTWTGPVLNMFHTLRGRFIYSLCYADNVLSQDIAEKLVGKIFENLKHVI